MSRMDDLIKIVTASNEEESFEDLLTLMNPDSHSKEEIQETYEEVFGYDPVTYYDRTALKQMLDHMKLSNDVPNDVLTILEEESDSIIEDAISRFESDREDHLSDALNAVIEERTGYNPNGEYDSEDDHEFDDDYDED